MACSLRELLCAHPTLASPHPGMSLLPASRLVRQRGIQAKHWPPKQVLRVKGWPEGFPEALQDKAWASSPCHLHGLCSDQTHGGEEGLDQTYFLSWAQFS